MIGINLEIPNFKSWKTAFLLSILIPVTLIAVFKKEPLTISETISLSPMEWMFQRPYPEEGIGICHWLNATHDDSEISFAISLEIVQFITGNMTWIPPGDSIGFVLFVNTSVDSGSRLQYIEIMFRNDSQPSYVWIRETSLRLTNLTLTYLRETYDIREFDKNRLILTGISNSNMVGFKATGEWFLNDISPDAKDHTLEIAFELAYYNGTAYKKFVQPFHLTILRSVQPT
jgi:hypothetical protein